MSEQWLAVRRGWKIVLVAIVLGLVAATVQTGRVVPSYISSTRLFVAAETDSNDPDELFYRNQIAAGRISSYVELISGDAAAEAAAEVLGNGVTPAALASQVKASTIVGTVILDIQATGASPEEAQEVAAAYAETVPQVIASVETVGDARAAQVNVTTIAEPTPGAPATPSTLRNLVLGGLLGLALGVGISVLWAAVKREHARAGSEVEPAASA